MPGNIASMHKNRQRSCPSCKSHLIVSTRLPDLRFNPLPDDKILDRSIETNCRRHFKVHFK